MIGNYTEKRIISGIKSGDERALDECMSKYSKFVAYIVGNIIGKALPQEDKEEVAADVFIQIWKNRERLDVNRAESFKSLIGTIARNLSKNKLRDSGHTLTMEEINENFPDKIDIENDLMRKDIEDKILKCIASFDREDRYCFIQYYYYHKKIKDICTDMDLSESAVKSKLQRGRKRIRETLYQEVMEDDM